MIKNFKSFINEKKNEYDIVYRGIPNGSDDISINDYIWISYDYDFAKEYGNVIELKLPKNTNLLDTEMYSEWEELVDEYDEDGDYDEYKYEPTNDFIIFLKNKGYGGFINGDNILIFDKHILTPLNENKK